MKSRLKKTIKSRVFQSLLITALFLIAGVLFGVNSWNKTVYVQLTSGGQGRYTASENRNTEVLSLSLEEYREQIQKKIFGHTKTEDHGEWKKFYLGNFLIQKDGTHRLICQAYSFVEMTFIALGVTHSGSFSEMVLQAPCRTGDTETTEEEEFIGPFPVPVGDILSRPDQKSFSIPEEEVLIHFYRAMTALKDPSITWLLKAVRFFNSPEEPGFIVRFIPGEETDAFELSLR